MATIKISEMEDIFEGTTPDLVNTRDFADLHELETRSIHGGACYYNGQPYTIGARKTMGGVLMYCKDRLFRSDKWEQVGK